MHFGCVAMIAIAWGVAGVGIFINAKNGQRLSIDVEGSNLNWWVLFAVSIAPVAAMSWGGLMSRAGKPVVAGAWFGLAVLFVCFNVWMAGEYLGDQMLGRAEQARDQKSSNEKIANMTNEEILRSKRETEDKLLRALTATKDPIEKKRLEEQLKEVQQRPLAFIAPMDGGPSVGARASWLSKVVGWSKETVEGITPNVVPIVMAAVELFFSFAGFSQWPKPRNDNSGEFTTIQRKFTKIEAGQDAVARATAGQPIQSGVEASRLWNVSEATACNWLRDFRKTGLIRRERNGTKLAIVRATNGAHAGVSS